MKKIKLFRKYGLNIFEERNPKLAIKISKKRTAKKELGLIVFLTFAGRIYREGKSEFICSHEKLAKDLNISIRTVARIIKQAIQNAFVIQTKKGFAIRKPGTRIIYKNTENKKFSEASSFKITQKGLDYINSITKDFFKKLSSKIEEVSNKVKSYYKINFEGGFRVVDPESAQGKKMERFYKGKDWYDIKGNPI